MALFNIFALLVILAAAAYSSPVFDSSFADSFIKIPKDCENKQLCDALPENYPQDYFNEYVRSMQNKDFMRTRQYEGEPPEKINLDEENCSTREVIIQPYILKSNTTAKLVVQTEYYKQKVKQTECLNVDRQCFGDIVKLGYNATCTPTYGTLKLYVYNTETNTFEYEAVVLPVCCYCSLKSTF